MRKTLLLLAHALVVWALCGATMGIGMATMSMNTTLIVHAIAAPSIFAVISVFYFKRFSFTLPLATALIFVGYVISIDFFLVALVINRSLDMFKRPLGTWIPFALIFASTFLTGLLVTKKDRP